jgi:hypothetical protein
MKTFKQFLKESKIKFIIDKDLSVIAHQDVDISDQHLSKILVKFYKVKGYFDCSNNDLNSLQNYPYHLVEDNFTCDNNLLSSLEFSPDVIYGNFYCRDNTVKFTEDEVYKVSNVDGDIFV